VITIPQHSKPVEPEQQMVHIIPLSIAQRRSDADNAEHPDAAPASVAVRPFDAEWQALAEHHRQRVAQQQAFDTEIAARRLDGEIAGAEADATANAATDGEGLHHAMYAEVDRRTGRVVEKGRFDTLFDAFVKQAPAGLRAGLASRKETLREAGSTRMAVQQLQRRAKYEQDHLATVQAEELGNVAKGDPDDAVAFDAARNAGLNLIARMNLDPESRQKAEADWRESTARTRIEALIARDPRRALEMLGGGAAAGDDQALSLSDRFNRAVPTYGNYGGRGWTGGAWGGGFDLSPLDIQDGFYKQHDQNYHDAKTFDDTIAADRQLIASLKSYLDNKDYAKDPALKTDEERGEASKYAWRALKVFQGKVALDVYARDEGQKAYDDAQSAIGRARFGSGMSFGNW